MCDWCFAIQEESHSGSDIRNPSKRVRNSVGFGECTNITHNRNGKRNLRQSCVKIDGQITNLLEKKKMSESGDSTDRKIKKKYKLLHEILC